MNKRIVILAAWLIVGTVGTAGAQMDQSHMHHGEMPSSPVSPSALPTEPGQGAFAAISEIVAMLSADPDTDWSRVSIDALRAHLVDMNNLIMKTSVDTRDIPDGIEVTIPKSSQDNGAALRMVPAHAPVLASETGWSSKVEDRADKLIWRVTSDSDEARIRALGFYGLMATGDHHRAHHLAIAKGMPMN